MFSDKAATEKKIRDEPEIFSYLLDTHRVYI